MNIVAIGLIILVILFHIYAFWLEAIIWNSTLGRKAFGTTREFAAESYPLAINQGVYNLFLAAGLIWSLLDHDPIAFQLKLFFLGCVMVAAVVGGLTVSKKIMLVQGLPALIALIMVLMFR